MPEHRQVLVDAPFCGPILVDAGLASTLAMVWKEGYTTINSCEDNHGQIWIEFDQYSFELLVQRAHAENLCRFLETSCRTEVIWQDDGDTIHFYASMRFDRDLLDTFTKLFKLAHKDGKSGK
jgi:hypothetical protein